MTKTSTEFDWLAREAGQHPYAVFFAVLSGAHMYGFPSGDSDFDIRGAHVVALEDAIGMRPVRETVDVMYDRQGREVDIVTHDLERFAELLLAKNAMVLEQLLSPLVIVAQPEFDELRDVGLDCITRHHAHHYIGFANSRFDAFEETRRLKDLLYAYRSCLTGTHLMRTGQVETNLRALADEYGNAKLHDLIDAKRGGTERMELPCEVAHEYRPDIESLLGDLRASQEATNLPQAPPPEVRERLDDLLVRVRLRTRRG
jgi:uncharacterized protein